MGRTVGMRWFVFAFYAIAVLKFLCKTSYVDATTTTTTRFGHEADKENKAKMKKRQEIWNNRDDGRAEITSSSDFSGSDTEGSGKKKKKRRRRRRRTTTTTAKKEKKEEQKTSLAPEHHSILVDAYGNFRSGRHDDALQQFDRILEHYPAHWPAMSARGALMAMKGDTSAALAAWSVSLSLNPADANALVNRGKMLADSGRIDEALANLDAAVTVSFVR